MGATAYTSGDWRKVALSKLINLKGDLFATGASFAGQGLIRLGSSLILTRLLRPEAYGTITILMSLMYFVEMISDIGITTFIVRDPCAEQPEYLNTAWTMRLVRSVLNGLLFLILGPLIATRVYHAPAIGQPLQLFSLWFFILGAESMSFPLAVRRKQSRIVMYSELLAAGVSSLFTILFCYWIRSYWGMVYGILLNRLLLTCLSYYFFREYRPRIRFDRAAAHRIFGVSRFTLPSSLLTLVYVQFDKVVFLRLFDLAALGIYGVAGNIAGAIESLVSSISHMVLYPRCAQYFNSDPTTFVRRYYTENTKLFVSILIVPAAVGGAAHLLIAILYDPRYAEAGFVLQAFMVRASLLALASPPEDLLIASGETHVILVGSLLRAAWVVVGSLTGYLLFGFEGFVIGTSLNGLPPLIYYWALQHRRGYLIARYEVYRVLFVFGVALAGLIATHLVFSSMHVSRIRLH